MISIYLHIPFCKKKCKYCSFLVVPHLDYSFIENYYIWLLKEIDRWSVNINEKKVKTIYLGWGTPFFLWKNNIFYIIEYLSQKFNIEYLEEINIELNPSPYNDILEFIEEIWKKRNKFYRIRFSFWIQSFEDEILKYSWRDYTFIQLKSFLRDLQKIKKANFLYNFDFIAFWVDWKDYQKKFFENFVKSYMADSFSVYMLELFPWNIWDINISEDKIIEEYNFLVNTILNAWYKRYEISNFSLVWKQCLHNLVYWNLEDWIWIGIWAWSFLKSDKINIDNTSKYIKLYNPPKWKKYFTNDYKKVLIELNDYDYKYEKLMMWLRKNEFLNLDDYLDILESNYLEKINYYHENWYIEFLWKNIKLTNKWYLIYNHIFTDLIK